MNTEKGFLILAHGKEFYLKWAYNLALSIKCFTDIPICLVTDLDLSEIDRSGISEVVDSITHAGGLKPFHAKTRLPEFTPFEKTIYIDADSLCINDPTPLFSSNSDFATHVYKRWASFERDQCSMIWANLANLWDYYNIPLDHSYPETNSSYIYFENNPRTRKLFELAEMLYSANPFPDYDKSQFRYYPDELAFNTALSLINYRGEYHQSESPIYFHGNSHGLPDFATMEKEKTFISLYGVDSTHGHLYKYYDRRKNEMFRNKYGHTGEKIKREFKAVGRVSNYPKHEPFKKFDEERFKKLIEELR